MSTTGKIRCRATGVALASSATCPSRCCSGRKLPTQHWDEPSSARPTGTTRQHVSLQNQTSRPTTRPVPPDQPATNQHQHQGLCPMLDKPLVGVTRTFHRTLCNPPWPGHRHSLTIDFVEFRGCGVSCTLLRLSPHSRLLELALFRDCSGFSGPGRVWWVVVRVRAGARDLYIIIEKDNLPELAPPTAAQR